MGFSVSVVATLEWGELSADDILFIAYPLQRLDPARLGAYLNAGGNAVIADDFGEAKDAMRSLGLLRAETAVPDAVRHEGQQPWAPVAVGRPDHPIGRDVGEVITNHPAMLTHVEGASTVAAFKNGAVVVAGERGSGRFVAVSDPSIFINRMLLFPGNLQLATNALKWLNRGGRARHIVVVRGDVQMYGEPRETIYDPRAGEVGRSIADLNFWLSERRAWLLTPGRDARARALARVAPARARGDRAAGAPRPEDRRRVAAVRPPRAPRRAERAHHRGRPRRRHARDRVHPARSRAGPARRPHRPGRRALHRARGAGRPRGERRARPGRRPPR